MLVYWIGLDFTVRGFLENQFYSRYLSNCLQLNENEIHDVSNISSILCTYIKPNYELAVLTDRK